MLVGRDGRGAGPTASERRNAISIVVKLEFEGKSILFTGDTVGRRLSDPDDACKDAEKIMVDRNDDYPLKADVLIAPHHGGNNGSSKCFLEAVLPKFVVFSAGHEYGHPSKGTAKRAQNAGVRKSNIFRTDRGDDEDSIFEWKEGSVDGCKDGRGDDDVEIVLPRTGNVRVEYRRASSGC